MKPLDLFLNITLILNIGAILDSTILKRIEMRRQAVMICKDYNQTLASWSKIDDNNFKYECVSK